MDIKKAEEAKALLDYKLFICSQINTPMFTELDSSATYRDIHIKYINKESICYKYYKKYKEGIKKLTLEISEEVAREILEL